MNQVEKEIKLDKLKNNTKRVNYLRALSISTILIDSISYIGLESIELCFTEFGKNYWMLAFFITKVFICF